MTHIHNDHFFGIEAFKDLPIYASQQALEDYNKFEQEGKLSLEYRQGYIEAIKEKAANGEFTLSEAWHNDYAVNYLKANIFPITAGISDEKVFGSPEQNSRLSTSRCQWTIQRFVSRTSVVPARSLDGSRG